MVKTSAILGKLCAQGAEDLTDETLERILRIMANLIKLESLSPQELQDKIAADKAATSRLLEYLDARQIRHSGQISTATLASVACDEIGTDEDAPKHGRTYRKWLQAGIMPIAAKRAIIGAAYGK